MIGGVIWELRAFDDDDLLGVWRQVACSNGDEENYVSSIAFPNDGSSQ